MRREDSIRLRHMLDAARLAVSFATGRERKDLEGDARTVLAMVKAIEIVGEAAARLAPELQAEHGEIPWADVIAMRNRLVHAYFDIDLDILWNTVVEDLPELISSLEPLCPEQEP